MTQAVFYFGGYKASDPDIDAWLKSARVQKPAIDFFGFPWTKGANWSAEGAVNGFREKGKLDSVVGDIKKNGSDTIFIVGHSSGCAIANAVDKQLSVTTNIVLVTLDGFRPDDDQLDRTTTQIWGAQCDDKSSRNFPKGDTKGRLRVFTATNCHQEWALHFSLVNANSSDSLVDSVASGYANCKANLLFL